MARETIEVPITGRILNILAKVGETVSEGDVICTLESMKMENPILSTVSGKVVEIKVTVNKVVNPGDVIAVIEY